MTSKVDRRHRIQQYPKSMVNLAIDEMIYGDDNMRIVRDIFVGNLTHKQVAAREHIEERSLYKRLDNIMPPMEDYLRRLN